MRQTVIFNALYHFSNATLVWNDSSGFLQCDPFAVFTRRHLLSHRPVSVQKLLKTASVLLVFGPLSGPVEL
jgi:hypothetical protein